MSTAQQVYVEELTVAVAAAKRAGAAIQDLYERAAAASYVKGDGSPVTDADLAADCIIRRVIGDAFPADAILTEEGADDRARLNAAHCWVVDPIDGTKQFIERTGEFDVLIALVVAGRPVVGVSYQPPTGLLIAATAGGGAFVEQNGTRRPLRLTPAAGPPRIVTSHWLGAPASMPVLSRVAARLGAPPPAMSELGIYTRTFISPENEFDALIGYSDKLTQPMGSEWDATVADLVIHEAGGRVSDLAGRLHIYNKPAPKNVGGLVLAVDPATHTHILRAIKPELARRR